jgi:phytoene synthase
MYQTNHITQNFIQSIDFDQVKDHPNILIASHLWDEERNYAAKVCYKFMRKIDDLVDDRKAHENAISCLEKQDLTDQVNEWIDCLHNHAADDPLIEELVRNISRFKIPLQPYYLFARSMIYDINHNGFDTFDDFLTYAEGASNSPATIFLHLCCLENNNGEYQQPFINIPELARPCAMFSYLVHIIRDFQKDQANNLNYFANDILERNGLIASDLSDIASGKVAVPDKFRRVIAEYYVYAEKYKEQTEDIIKCLKGNIGERYYLSLKIIFDLYLQIFERIDIENGSFSTEELVPTSDEVKSRVIKCLNTIS